jgi:hypothetical protein
MKLLEALHQHAEKIGISFLLAGGHAVNVYIAGRQTGDIDLVVPTSQKEEWKNLVIALNYSLYFECDSFLQFQPPDLGLWPLDFIIVDDATFKALKQESVPAFFSEATCYPAVSPKHLIAMKCHAAKQPDRDDRIKDIRDIVELAKHIKLDPSSEEFAVLCRKYGNEELLAKIRNVI